MCLHWSVTSWQVGCPPTRRVARIWKRGGYFERVRKVQTTLTRIFIFLGSGSHGLSENLNKISRKARKFEGFFHPKSGGLQILKKQKKKVFAEIETDFSAKFGNSNVLRGGCFSMGGGFFHKKSASKALKTCDFAYFTSQWGARAPRPPPWLRCCPQPIQKLHMLLEQLCIIDLTLSKCRLNKGHFKTLHINRHLLIGRNGEACTP